MSHVLQHGLSQFYLCNSQRIEDVLLDILPVIPSRFLNNSPENYAAKVGVFHGRLGIEIQG